MVVAFHFPHNEGVVYGVFTEPDQTTELTLVDLYEVDGQIRTFKDESEARLWLNGYREVINQGEIKPNIVYDIPDDELRD